MADAFTSRNYFQHPHILSTQLSQIAKVGGKFVAAVRIFRIGNSNLVRTRCRAVRLCAPSADRPASAPSVSAPFLNQGALAGVSIEWPSLSNSSQTAKIAFLMRSFLSAPSKPSCSEKNFAGMLNTPAVLTRPSNKRSSVVETISLILSVGLSIATSLILPQPNRRFALSNSFGTEAVRSCHDQSMLGCCSATRL